MNKKYLFERDEDDNFILQIDNSTLEKYTTCPKSFYWGAILGRIPPNRAALTAGGSIHAGLEVLYRDSPGMLELGLIEAQRAALEAYDAPCDFNEWRTPERVLETLRDYTTHYAMDDLDPTLDTDGNRMVEIPFSVPLCTVDLKQYIDIPEPTLTGSATTATMPMYMNKVFVYWTGKIDLVCNQGGKLWLVDHKTTSMLGPNFWEDFELSQQTVGYTWALRKMLDKDPAGFIANVFAWRKQTKSGKPLEFHRKKYFYKAWKLDEWEINTQHIVDDMLHSLTRNYFPCNRKWCLGKYGRCQYLDACNMPEESRHLYIASPDYTDNTWSPLNH